ncbi:glycosyltransferase family 87 protein [Chryseolinea sp. H1M3-3]|uniref:glycosyltransferase family 87 protein n=1 Tax=Chryseolinea sp. H1M3-3 TaxID=3034144 RepID=UPI0023EC0A81|nr:glycosyltransferase family 87 protein [Chryseolinea sp. H1M3-3]
MILKSTYKVLILKYSGWILTLTLIGHSLVQSHIIGGNDFANSYFGASFYLHGKFDLGIFDPYTFNKTIYDQGYRNLFLNYNPNPPSTAIFFIPFALLPLYTAKLLFNITTIIFFLVSVYRLCNYFNVNYRVIMLCIPIVFFIPIRNQILFGQSYFLIFTLLAEGVIAYNQRKFVLTSVMWSIAIFIKVFPAIVVLFLLLKKDWKQIFYLGCFCTLILFFSVSLQGVEIWKEYLVRVLPRNNQGEIHAAYLTTYQSALMMFKYLFVRDEILNPEPVIDSLPLFKISLLLFKATILALCTMIVLNRKDFISFAVTLACGILISPYGSTYSNILLLILLIALEKEKNSTIFWVYATIIFLLGNLPVSAFEAMPVILRFPRLILMCFLVILIWWSMKVQFNAKVFGIYLLLLGVPILFQSNMSKDPSKLLLTQHKHNLIFDYGVTNGILFYTYWYDGPEKQDTDIAVEILETNKISIKNNQIFFQEEQLTNSSDNKINASLLSDNRIIYLSDKGKGIGFYTIRVINLKNERH